jgi:nucleotidyltransferase substrate binding protein (TIGR01987 family)
MEELKEDFVQLNKALKTVDEALSLCTEVMNFENQKILLAAEDSVIKRFEYTYETFWKFLKKYLETVLELKDLNSPKKVFYASVKVEVCTLQEASIFINMADNRNETSHKYSIDQARGVLAKVPLFYETMLAVTKRLGEHIQK